MCDNYLLNNSVRLCGDCFHELMDHLKRQFPERTRRAVIEGEIRRFVKTLAQGEYGTVADLLALPGMISKETE